MALSDYQRRVLDDGATAYWPLDDPSGTVARDLVGTPTEPPPCDLGQAYLWARSGIARSCTTRSNYVTPYSTVDLIVRDDDGAIISRTDITDYIRHGSLSVSQALNDEPDTCNFQIVPTAPASAVPQVGQEIAVGWTAGAVVFRGYALVVQFDRRPMNESPWVSVQCQDSMWRFDARIVTWQFPAQSVTESIKFLVQWFCNLSGAMAHASDFRTTFVQNGMPSIPALDVINERPSTVMRRLLAAVGGGFYVDGFDLHAWAGSLSEPNQTQPAPLVNDLASLKSFRVTHDATNLRRAVLVEGRRTGTLIALPTFDSSVAPPIGIPLGDASFFDPALGVDHDHLVRMGTQWLRLQHPVSVTAGGVNPPQSRVQVAFTPGDPVLSCDALTPPPPLQGWIRIGNQYAAYQSSSTTAGTLDLVLSDPALHPYGYLTVPMAVGETVEWVDSVMEDFAAPLSWIESILHDGRVWAQPTDAPVVTLAVAQQTLAGWPPLEGFVQDGRYSYAGAQARAEADLEAFKDPLITAEWETEDLNAAPGRQQEIHLTGSSVIDPLDLTLTITSVELSFPLRTQPPRRRCTGGVIKTSTFLDVVLTQGS